MREKVITEQKPSSLERLVRRIIQTLHHKRMVELTRKTGVYQSIPQTLQFLLACLTSILSHLFLMPVLLMARKIIGIFSWRQSMNDQNGLKAPNTPNELSDPAHGTHRLQPRRSRRVRCSAWLAVVSVCIM